MTEQMKSYEIESALHQALALHQRNKLEHAEALYKEILKVVPNNFTARHLLGVIEYQRGNFQEAVVRIGRALLLNPGDATAQSNLGNAFLQLKQYEKALACFDRALKINPNYADVLQNRGSLLCELGRFEEALASYGRLLALHPDHAEVLRNCGAALATLGRHEEALAIFDRALAANPNYAEALNDRANTLRDLGRHEEALASYDRALKIRPDFVEALNNRGTLFRKIERHAEALASYDLALKANPNFAEVLHNRGITLLDLCRPEEALASYDRALAIRPDYAEALYARGTVLRDLDRQEEALASYDRALTVKPHYAEALYGRGAVLRQLIRYEEAAAAFEQLLLVEPELNYASGEALHARLHCCDWEHYDRNVARVVNGVATGKRASLPFAFLAATGSSEAQLQCAQIYCRNSYPASTAPVWRGELYHHDKIRVAYLSGDLHDHPTAYLTAGLFEAHDKTRFETTAISFGPDRGGEIRCRLARAFTRFIDVRNESDRGVALLLRDLEIDIAIDLSGHTGNNRLGIFALRPAPIQVNYLGYPGTMGAEYIDYIVADRIVIPEQQHSFYTEKIAYLPDTYQPNDAKRAVSAQTPTRQEAGLPESGFVFCAFNNTYKITPPVFEIWMRLLRQVDGSVLWLIEGNGAAIRNLRWNAEIRGIAPDRLVFAPRMKQEDHLARHRLADLFLDNLPYNAHTTASDALWLGVPVVTCLGSGFAGRVAASLLHAVGLPEMITETLEAYEQLALALARAPERLAALKVKLMQNGTTFPLFNTDRYRRHIEAAYERMWARYQRNEPPVSFAVEPWQ
jgi:predicted O-linked N-acetylglucosamine transferase (SPINDLY family)